MNIFASRSSRFARACALLMLAALSACGDSESEPQGTRAPINQEEEATWCKAKAVLVARCANCHDGQGTAGTPMALNTYADVVSASTKYPGKKLYERVKARIHDTQNPMPPGGNLTEEEMAALDAFVEGGAKGSDDVACNAVISTSEGKWPDHCDATYKLLAHAPESTAPFTVPARKSEHEPFQDHPQISLDAPWGDEEVQMIGYRAITDKKPVVHHWILYEQRPGGGQGAFLQGWSPGKDEGGYPLDVGMIMPKGPKSMVLDFHYFNDSDQEYEDASGLEICVLKKPNFREKSAGVYSGFSSLLFAVYRGEMNKDIVSNCIVSTSGEVHLFGSSPHMHMLGVHAKLEVTRPNGEKVTVHDAPFYFEEQTSRGLTPEVILRNGDRVTTTCRYSFPKDDTFHKDHDGNLMDVVTFGEDTENEMCFNFAAYYPLNSFVCIPQLF